MMMQRATSGAAIVLNLIFFKECVSLIPFPPKFNRWHGFDFLERTCVSCMCWLRNEWTDRAEHWGLWLLGSANSSPVESGILDWHVQQCQWKSNGSAVASKILAEAPIKQTCWRIDQHPRACSDCPMRRPWAGQWFIVFICAAQTVLKRKSAFVFLFSNFFPFWGNMIFWVHCDLCLIFAVVSEVAPSETNAQETIYFLFISHCFHSDINKANIAPSHQDKFQFVTFKHAQLPETSTKTPFSNHWSSCSCTNSTTQFMWAWLCFLIRAVLCICPQLTSMMHNPIARRLGCADLASSWILLGLVSSLSFESLRTDFGHIIHAMKKKWFDQCTGTDNGLTFMSPMCSSKSFLPPNDKSTNCSILTSELMHC